MKTFLVLFSLLAALARTAFAADLPRRVPIAPLNDLSAIATALPAGMGFSICRGRSGDAEPENRKEFEEGARIATINWINGIQVILVIDDGKKTFPEKDIRRGLPVVILTRVVRTSGLEALVDGYNSSVRTDFQYEEVRRRGLFQ